MIFTCFNCCSEALLSLSALHLSVWLNCCTALCFTFSKHYCICKTFIKTSSFCKEDLLQLKSVRSIKGIEQSSQVPHCTELSFCGMWVQTFERSCSYKNSFVRPHKCRRREVSMHTHTTLILIILCMMTQSLHHDRNGLYFNSSYGSYATRMA